MIEYKIADVKPAPYNPRSITDAAFAGLKESLKKFGLVDPLIVNSRTGYLVGGHQRLKAAESIGMKTVPVVELDLSPAEEKALNITLNNQGISGDFNEGLKELLDEIQVELGDDFMNELEFNCQSIQQSLQQTMIQSGSPNREETTDEDFEFNASKKNENDDTKLSLKVTCETQLDQEELFQELNDRGYKVSVC